MVFAVPVSYAALETGLFDAFDDGLQQPFLWLVSAGSWGFSGRVALLSSDGRHDEKGIEL